MVEDAIRKAKKEEETRAKQTMATMGDVGNKVKEPLLVMVDRKTTANPTSISYSGDICHGQMHTMNDSGAGELNCGSAYYFDFIDYYANDYFQENFQIDFSKGC